MESSTLFISLILNAVLVTVTAFCAWELRKSRDRLFRKDGFIKQTKVQLHHAREEVHRKETVILKEKGKGRWTIQFFVEEESSSGLFKNTHIVKYRFQTLHNGFPVGPAGTVSEQRYSEVDKDQVNQLLQDLAKPLLEAGLEVAVKRFAA